MKIQRTKNAGRNLLFGMLQKTHQIIVPFVMRTIIIYYMGIEYAGINNLFSSILQVLNLAELGIASALTYCMYAPIAEDDTDKICALLGLCKKFCFVIGLIILGIGLLLVPFLTRLIAGDIPDTLNLYVLYFMYLGNTVATYWVYAYKYTLIHAHQRDDVYSKVSLLTNTIQFTLQIIVLFVFRNFYLYLIVAFLSRVVTNLLVSYRVDRMYPDYRPRGKVSSETIEEIKKKVQGLVTNKIGGTIIKSADSIVISAFLGLSVLAMYQNYFFILTSVTSIIYIFYQSTIAGIGNSLIVENAKKNYMDFNTMTFGISWISTICASCLLGLYQPFMKLWMGEALLLDYPVIICLVLYFYVYEIDQMIGAYKDAAGVWYEDRYRPLLTALLNLGLNLIFVRYIGLYGVLLSTVISLVFLGIPWMIHNIFKCVFKEENPFIYFGVLLKYSVATVFTVAVTFIISDKIPDKGIATLFAKSVVCTVVAALLYFLIFIRNRYLERFINMGKRLLNKRARKAGLTPHSSTHMNRYLK